MKAKREEEEKIKNIRNENGLIDYGKLMKKTSAEERKINNELVKKSFFINSLRHMLKISISQKIILKKIKNK